LVFIYDFRFLVLFFVSRFCLSFLISIFHFLLPTLARTLT
jgi:hypothetical protein